MMQEIQENYVYNNMTQAWENTTAGMGVLTAEVMERRLRDAFDPTT